MDMVGSIISGLIAPDVVGVQAIDNRVGMINILEYVAGSDKAPTAKGTTFASPLAYQGLENTYSSSAVTGEDVTLTTATIGGVTHYVAPVKWGPVKSGSVDIAGTAHTGLGGFDATVGHFIDLGTTSVTGTGKANYFYDNETAPVTAPTIGMQIKSLPIETKARKLNAIWAFDAAYELEKELTA